MNMSAQDFLNLTRYEFVIKRKERDKAEIQRINEQRAQAWYVAMLERQPKLPDLKDILLSNEPAHPPAQTPEQMLASLRMITMVMGGKITEV